MQTTPTLHPAAIALHTVESLSAEHGVPRPWIYWLVLAGILAGLASLPLVIVDVSVRAPGIVRPATERTELKPAHGGRIARVLVNDNDRVAAGQTLLALDSADIDERLARNRNLHARATELISDLVHLTTAPAPFLSSPIPEDPASSTNPASTPAWVAGARAAPIPQPATPHLRQDYLQAVTQLRTLRLGEERLQLELTRISTLAAKGIATQRELDDARFGLERARTELGLYWQQTTTRWQARLDEEDANLQALLSEQSRLETERSFAELRAPVAGTVQGFAGLSAGVIVSAGQVLGSISPDDTLIVETLCSPHDIGFIRPGQNVKLQVDAFPYTEWGLLDGVVDWVANDISAPNAGSGASAARPFFKVIVRPTTTALVLPNGAIGPLKKGLTLNARYQVARRSLLQVLYDNLGSWIDPRAGATR